MPSDAELAAQTLTEESKYRFSSFDSADALALGLSIRKRFRSTSRHVKGKGLVISIQTISGHTLFSCTVGDLGHPTGFGDVVSLDSWSTLEGMISIVRRLGHSSFYVEKGMSASGKSPKKLGIEGDSRICGGAFPIWLEVLKPKATNFKKPTKSDMFLFQNAPCCPIAVAACYSGSSQEDHTLVATTIRDYLVKQKRDSQTYAPTLPAESVARQEITTEWPRTPSNEVDPTRQIHSPFDNHEGCE